MWNSLFCAISGILQIYAVSSVPDGRPMSRCKIWRKESMKVPGSFIPLCNSDGTFASTQCRFAFLKVRCWEVDKNGHRKKGKKEKAYIFSNSKHTRLPKYYSTRTQQPLTNDASSVSFDYRRTVYPSTENEIVEPDPFTKTEPPKTNRPLTKCERLRLRRMSFFPRRAVTIPTCTKDGHFRREQCNLSKSKCWCVGKTGKRIPGTKVRNQYPNCYPGACGKRFPKPPSRHRRVVGGRASVPNTWPWQALVLFSDPKHICGGTLIKKNWLVTAASCFGNYTRRKSEWHVKLGAHKLNSNSDVRISVEAIHIHPNYKPANETHPGDNDVALLQVASSARIPRNVMPLCLPENTDYYKKGARCSITGWGHTSYNGSLSKVLREAWVDLVPLKECNAEKSYNGTLSNRFMCAGYREGGMDACHFDTGGPLACPIEGGVWTLAGIVSWRQSCAQPYKYGIYTNVHKVKPWIEKIINR